MSGLLDGFEEIGDSHRLPEGMIGAKAAITNEDNEFAKREARARGMKAVEYLGILLTEAIQTARQDSKVEIVAQLEEQFGPNWRERIGDVI